MITVKIGDLEKWADAIDKAGSYAAKPSFDTSADAVLKKASYNGTCVNFEAKINSEERQHTLDIAYIAERIATALNQKKGEKITTLGDLKIQI